MSKIYPDSQIVDENDQPIGQMQLPDALRQGKILQVARVFIFNPKGELLLQERGPQVIAPGLWNESASGHVDAGETYLQTAIRELEEEVGVNGVELRQEQHFFLEEHDGGRSAKRFHTLFVGEFSGEPKISDFSEVASFRWATLDELDKKVVSSPEKFTGGFLEVYKRYRL